MLRLLSVCVLLSMCVGCGYEWNYPLTKATEEPVPVTSVKSETKVTKTVYSATRRMEIIVDGKVYNSTLVGGVEKELGGKRLIWIDADNNRHELTSNEIIKHMIYVQDEAVNGPAPAANAVSESQVTKS